VITPRAYRFALDPTAAQRQSLASHCGAARRAFNWGLEQVGASLALREFELCMFGEMRTTPLGWSLYALRREWNQEKDKVAPWWRENSKEAYNSGLDALARALKNYSDSRQGKRTGPRVGFPRFRKKGRPIGFRFTTGAIRVDGARHVVLPRLGRIRACELTTALGERVSAGRPRILSASISCEAGRWFVSFGCLVQRELPAGNGHQDVVGVDLGVLHLATLSTGEVIEGPRALRAGLRKLRRLSRHCSRCRRGSRNQRKAAGRLARHHARIAHLRRDHLHKLTTTLAKNHGVVVIEDLNVRGMSRSARGSQAKPGRRVRAKSGLNRGVLDAGFAEFRRQMEYKCRWYGAELAVADRFFASSKTCSRCRTVNPTLRLGDRVFHCAWCERRIDRDLSAARNLEWWGEQHLVAGSAPETENACGGGVRPGRGPATPAEAGTGDVPEPAGMTGGRTHRAGPPPAP